MFKQQELNMLGKTGLILFIPSDFSWVHEAQISKAIYKLNTRYKNTPKRSSLRHDQPEQTNKYHFYNEGQH